MCVWFIPADNADTIGNTHTVLPQQETFTPTAPSQLGGLSAATAVTPTPSVRETRDVGGGKNSISLNKRLFLQKEITTR